MPGKKYCFLLTAMNSHASVNATLGFGELLARHGHEVSFAHLRKYRKDAEIRGFTFLPFSDGILGDDDSMACVLKDNFDSFRINPLERYKNFSEQDKERLSLLTKEFAQLEIAIHKIVAVHQNSFDAFIHDFCDLTRSLFATDRPVIPLMSANPLLLYHNGPPYSFGLSTESDPKIWQEVKDIFMEANSVYIQRTNAMLAEFDKPRTFDPLRLVSPGQLLGFYHYPASLDYEECLPKEDNWHRIDCFTRSDGTESINIPLELFQKPGKLIYFSLGPTVSHDLNLMREIIGILAKAPHKFIVSKGFRGDELTLPENMWGENYLDQIKVLQVVDLVITNGGNNSLMESLYYARPLIVIPYFFDQYDNAQRVVDKNIGHRINIWELSEMVLLDCIEKTLKDVDMHNRIKEISESMKKSDSGTKAVRMIETLIEELKASRASSRASSRSGSRPGSRLT